MTVLYQNVPGTFAAANPTRLYLHYSTGVTGDAFSAPAGDNRILLVYVFSDDPAAQNTPSWNSVTFTALSALHTSQSDPGRPARYCRIWYALEADINAGSNTITCTGAQTDNGWTVGVYSDVNQTTPFRGVGYEFTDWDASFGEPLLAGHTGNSGDLLCVGHYARGTAPGVDNQMVATGFTYGTDDASAFGGSMDGAAPAGDVSWTGWTQTMSFPENIVTAQVALREGI